MTPPYPRDNTPIDSGRPHVTTYTEGNFTGLGNPLVDGMAPAGPWRRLAAYLIDAILIAAFASALVSVIFGDAAESRLLMAALSAVVLWLYLSLLQMTGTQTVGKRLLGIRAVSEDGSALSTQQALTRNAWVLFSAIPYLGWISSILGIVIFATVFGGPKLQGAHDRLARTAVIRK